MSTIKFDTLCGATVEVDPERIESVHFPYGHGYTIERGEVVNIGQIVLCCDSQFMVDGDTFWKVAKAAEEAWK